MVLISDAPVPVARYGGTERVVGWLARGLAELGIEVTLLAPAGSHSPFARVVETTLPAGRERHFDPRPHLPPGTDIVHAHFPLHPVADIPLRWTLHGNARPGERLPPGGIALSADHAARHGMTDWVHNGLDPSEYRFAPAAGDYDLFLGRLHAVKGWRWAVEGARRTRRKLVVAGGWRPSLRPSLRFAGRVGGARKADLLAGAACLWVPAQWEEPFGLTTIEAMISGTPVLGTRRGALPEIVSPASGAIGETLDDLVRLRGGLDALDREAIRAEALARFTHRTMAEGYRTLYRRTLAG